MKRIVLIISALLLLSAATASAGDGIKYSVMFYNLENLFDTVNDPSINDEEFLPDGAKKWTEEKYGKKLHNMARVIAAVAKGNGAFPTVIGVSEIENRRVLDDLFAEPAVSDANYQIVHYDSPDMRGIDVALVYRPDQFKMVGSGSYRVHVPGYENFRTRDVLCVWGTIEGEMFGFIVDHMPSRRGGSLSSTPLRDAAATRIRECADSLSGAFPGIKIAIMGDMNDNPTDKSLHDIIGAGEAKAAKVKKGGYFNPFLAMYKDGFGTCAYYDEWSIFDNIIVNYDFIDGGRLRLQKSNYNKKYYGNIFKRPFMIQQSGQYKNYPLRTFSGNNFQNGFSDHLPVYILFGE